MELTVPAYPAILEKSRRPSGRLLPFQIATPQDEDPTLLVTPSSRRPWTSPASCGDGADWVRPFGPREGFLFPLTAWKRLEPLINGVDQGPEQRCRVGADDSGDGVELVEGRRLQAIRHLPGQPTPSLVWMYLSAVPRCGQVPLNLTWQGAWLATQAFFQESRMFRGWRVSQQCHRTYSC